MLSDAREWTMKRLKTASMLALGLALIGLTGCNQNRDRDDEMESGGYDQVGEARVYDERPVTRHQNIQASPVRQLQAQPQVARSTKSFHFNQVGETDISE